MHYEYHRPNAELSAFVRTVLIIEGGRDSDIDNLPIFTNGMPTLFCKSEAGSNILENTSSVSLFVNVAPPECWTVHDSTIIIAYFFKPFALTSLFKVAAKTLAKKPFDLSTWSPHKYNALKTQLVYADTIVRKIEVFDNLLILQHKENRETYDIVQRATEMMMQNPVNDILPEILTELQLNERTFQRIFKKYVGITPTQYRRISQFQGSFEQLRSKQFEKVSDVAIDNGFSDQSHFIRSFKEFTNTTPNDYLQNGLSDKK